jgi:hypothetical protein
MNNVPMRIDWESDLNTKAQVEGYDSAFVANGRSFVVDKLLYS